MLSLILVGVLNIPYLPEAEKEELVLCLRDPETRAMLCQHDNFDVKSCVVSEDIMVCKIKEVGI